MKNDIFVFCAIAILAVTSQAAAQQGVSCEALSLRSSPTVRITSSVVIRSSTDLQLPSSGRGGSEQALLSLPAFCRVAATLRPSTDSEIKIEVWMPVANWNGKFQAVGNGGFAGSIEYAAMAGALKTGYATSSTDGGHAGEPFDGSFALGHTEKVIDFAYRAVHEMTVTAKALIATFYGSGPKFSYWNGCSQGGRQGLLEAQQYPGDDDGIIASTSGAAESCLSLEQAIAAGRIYAPAKNPRTGEEIWPGLMRGSEPARGGVNFAVNRWPAAIGGVMLPAVPPQPGTPSK